MSEFQYEGEPAKWLLFPCQAKGADPEDRCRISIRPQLNASGAGWTVEGGDKPTAHPSILCGNKEKPICHFHIESGMFKPCGDHQAAAKG